MTGTPDPRGSREPTESWCAGHNRLICTWINWHKTDDIVKYQQKLASFGRMFFDLRHQLIWVSRDFLREVRERKAQTLEIKSLFRALLWKFSKSYPLGRFFSSTP